MNYTFTFISDPGHGWLEVDKAYLHSVEISGYSYYDPKTGKAYLEEDCDAGKFLDWLDSKKAKYTIIREYQENTFIRNLPHYNNVGSYYCY